MPQTASTAAKQQLIFSMSERGELLREAGIIKEQDLLLKSSSQILSSSVIYIYCDTSATAAGFISFHISNITADAFVFLLFSQETQLIAQLISCQL